MKSPKSLGAVLLLLGAIAFAVYYVRTNPWFNPRAGSTSSGPPQTVEGHGPTPEMMAKWRESQKAPKKADGARAAPAKPPAKGEEVTKP